MSDAIDLTAMYAMHDALRRELTHLDRITTSSDLDPKRILATSAGWQLFKQALHIHHTAEDDALWPALRDNLAGHAQDSALVEAMAAEHAAIDPLIAAIDAATVDAAANPGHIGELVDALVTGLTGHLRHEEDVALPLIQREVTPEQWAHFGQTHAQRIGPDAPRLLPWLLDGADERTVATMLAPLPEPAREAYAATWVPAYRALDRWGVGAAA
ncbi:hemerythrin domain-containing protein [Rhodococcus sp. D2-41]|uniref:Hemerythrin domain-containing protein n=1 Tax=Speluncibacter jeojiensis TaxID=2710754 RepID=A0A9X4LZA2_9ACTN|nr:hemerythrin domain-containing protein [Rhodococcus sp. D2-41]MDG3011712.1 hemerythrin domain-containing protein [Rhodococcus sp. D2-41]MDG3014934.1 hemerythrin domain-containing protein [Corynebacteriales bacterium D3-21]